METTDLTKTFQKIEQGVVALQSQIYGIGFDNSLTPSDADVINSVLKRLSYSITDLRKLSVYQRKKVVNKVVVPDTTPPVNPTKDKK